MSALRKQGRLTSDVYVWREGLADWQPLSQVTELQRAMDAVEPDDAMELDESEVQGEDEGATLMMDPDQGKDWASYLDQLAQQGSAAAPVAARAPQPAAEAEGAAAAAAAGFPPGERAFAGGRAGPTRFVASARRRARAPGGDAGARAAGDAVRRRAEAPDRLRQPPRRRPFAPGRAPHAAPGAGEPPGCAPPPPHRPPGSRVWLVPSAAPGRDGCGGDPLGAECAEDAPCAATSGRHDAREHRADRAATADAAAHAAADPAAHAARHGPTHRGPRPSPPTAAPTAAPAPVTAAPAGPPPTRPPAAGTAAPRPAPTAAPPSDAGGLRTLGRNEIMGVVNANTAALQACGAAQPDLKGTVVIATTIERDGSVSATAVTTSKFRGHRGGYLRGAEGARVPVPEVFRRSGPVSTSP
jgi:hypothetical protein